LTSVSADGILDGPGIKRRIQSLNNKNKKKGFTVEITVVLVIIVILLAALVPVMMGWNRDVQEVAVRNEGWIYLNAAREAVEHQPDSGTAAAYTEILADPKFAGFVQKADLSQIPPTAEGFPHINDIFVDSEGAPAAVFVRNVLRDGTETANGLIVGSTNDDGGFWLRGGSGPLAFGPVN
jgi:type II secretory pathway pseudopilin PulG